MQSIFYIKPLSYAAPKFTDVHVLDINPDKALEEAEVFDIVSIFFTLPSSPACSLIDHPAVVAKDQHLIYDQMFTCNFQKLICLMSLSHPSPHALLLLLLCPLSLPSFGLPPL